MRETTTYHASASQTDVFAQGSTVDAPRPKIVLGLGALYDLCRDPSRGNWSRDPRNGALTLGKTIMMAGRQEVYLAVPLPWPAWPPSRFGVYQAGPTTRRLLATRVQRVVSSWQGCRSRPRPRARPTDLLLLHSPLMSGPASPAAQRLQTRVVGDSGGFFWYQ